MGRSAELRWLGAGTLAAAAVVPLLPWSGPPCLLRTCTGVPCPLCGMTTGVVHAVHGRVFDAVAANPAAPVLVVAVVAAWVVAAVAAVAGVRGLAVRPPALSAGAARVAPWAVLALLWLVQLGRFGMLP